MSASSRENTSTATTRSLQGSLAAVFVLFGLYLVAAHYVMAYSDPVSWLGRAEAMMNGEPITRRAFLYPAFLIVALTAVGREWVFLANLPWVLLLAFLVYRLCRDLYNRPGSSTEGELSRWIGAAAVVLFILLNRRLFTIYLNPYREAMAFSLLLLSVLCLVRFFNGGRLWLNTASAVLMGLAASTRETTLLLFPAVVLLFAVSYLQDRQRRWLKAFGWYLAPMLLGLIPFFIQNHMHTGYFWLPAYASSRWLSRSGGLVLPDDLPIPGMSFSYFSGTGGDTLDYYLTKYTLVGFLLFALGVVQAVRRNNRPLLYMILPFTLGNALFYCWYWYFKARYTSIIDPFLAIFIAGGAVTTAAWLASRLPPIWKQRLQWSLAVLMPLITAVVLARAALTSGDRLKTWHIRPLQAFLAPHLEQPVSFAGRRHYRDMMAWFMEGESIHLKGFVEDFARNKTDQVEALGSLDALLAHMAPDQLARVRERNLYEIGNKSSALNTAWFDLDPVLSLEDAPVPLDHYSRPLEKEILRVSLWDRTSLTLDLGASTNSRTALLLDLRRITDYPDRTRLDAWLNDQPCSVARVSGAQLVPLPHRPGGGPMTLRLASDAPLPSRPGFQVWGMDEELTIPLGAIEGVWYYPHISWNILKHAPFKRDAVYLYDQGEIRVPGFASAGRRMHARLRLEFIHDDPAFVDERHVLRVSTPEGTVQRFLTGPKVQQRVTVDLGPGRGEPVMVPLTLETSLAPHAEQEEAKRARQYRSLAAVKLYDVTVSAEPEPTYVPFVLDVGSRRDDVFLLSGFHGPETYRNTHSVRWTAAESTLKIPAEAGAAGKRLLLNTLRVRPDDRPASPVFLWNGKELEASRVLRTENADREIRYELETPPAPAPDGGDDVLKIECRPWLPQEDGIPDGRELGLMVDRLEVLPGSPGQEW